MFFTSKLPEYCFNGIFPQVKNYRDVLDVSYQVCNAYITMLLHKKYCRYIFQYLFTLSQKGIMMFICKLSSLRCFKNLIWSKVTCHFRPQLLSTPGRTRHALHRTFREPTRQCNLAVKSLPAPANVVVARRWWWCQLGGQEGRGGAGMLVSWLP